MVVILIIVGPVAVLRLLFLQMSSTAFVRFEWFQTPTAITFVFFVKDRQEKNVEVEVEERSVRVTIDLDGLPGAQEGKSYQYQASPLFASLDTSVPVKVVVKSMKIEVSVTKGTSYNWPTLEAPSQGEGGEVKEIKISCSTDSTATGTTPAAVPAPKANLAYPNSKKRDWSTFAVNEEEEKPDGEAALQQLFQQIYGNGTDEQRKAMIKSFTESSGTVLSTNWEDVGSRNVTAEPPTGMESKKVGE